MIKKKADKVGGGPEDKSRRIRNLTKKNVQPNSIPNRNHSQEELSDMS